MAAVGGFPGQDHSRDLEVHLANMAAAIPVPVSNPDACPACGELPILDWNTAPKGFWDSAVQVLSCRNCKTRLVRYMGSGENIGKGPLYGYPPNGRWKVSAY